MRVRDYRTGEVLPGEPTAELVRKSGAERSGTGAVDAQLINGRWWYVAPEAAHDEALWAGDEIRAVVYVEGA